ncbi:hypothetical protein [uncultured Dokdonia sp.]|uniref:hypothetical protein n=1 Tax=uncultured Dokdonia sp. TaxID=575653 RepID=UPI00261F8E48|nr:hypothetical protein [uncultured Dokdonia sp.]
MEILVVLLLITHIIVLFLLWKYIKTYKENNFNYLNKELKTLKGFFSQGLLVLEKNVTAFTALSTASLDSLEKEHTHLISDHKSKFKEVTAFIKSDYTSLTELLKTNNDLLTNLLERTEENITKNNDLKPLLVNSNDELEKVYGKIKMVISNYEKNLKDIKEEIEDALQIIEENMSSKIKQIAISGEKTIANSLENSKDTIDKVTQETSSGLKKVLKENQIQLLTDKVGIMEKELQEGLEKVQENLSGLDEIFMLKLKDYQKELSNKKGFLGF